MLLNELLKNPTQSFMYLERYVNDGSPSGFTWKYQTSVSTSPKSENEYFYLYEMYLNDNINQIGVVPNSLKILGNKMIYIHPDMCERYKKNNLKIVKSNIRVAPTSSFRTVKLLDYPGYIKLNYNGIIGRIDRSLTDKHAYASVEMTKYLKCILYNNVYSSLCFFPEPYAKFYVDNKNNFGMVFREEKPYGINSSKIKNIIPVFSLFSKDPFKTDDDCLLIQLIKKSGKNPEEFVLENIIFLIIDNYFNLILNDGIQPEWHAQNLLLGIGSDFSVVSIIMRDLESIDIDKTLRDSIGKTDVFMSYPYKYLNDSQYNYQIKHSFMYDYKIGEYIFTPIIKCLSKYYKLDEKIFSARIKEYCKAYLDRLPNEYFPKNGLWYSFDNVLIDRSTKSRPYILNYNAKYRG